jgi:predicted RNA-binding protein with RPS1 domain
MDHRDVPEPTPVPVELPPAVEAHASDDVPVVASGAHEPEPLDAAASQPAAAEIEPSPAPAVAEAAPPETPRPAAAPVDTDTDAHRSAFGEPIASEPAASEPVASEPAPSEPAPSEPVASEPVAGEPAAAQTPASETAAGEATEGEAAPVAADGQPEQPAPPPVDPRRLRAQHAWERVVAAHTNGEQVTGTVTAAVKGGLLVDVGGIRGFLPASQVRVPIGTAIEALVKTKVPLKVLDVDTGRRRIVVSQRRAVDEERRTKRSELLRSLEVGQIREAVVARLADFGAFVDLGGIDGLIPMRELAFERVEKTGDVVSVGERVTVQVLRIEEGGKKIALSRKNALPDPWRDHAALLRNGSTHEGRVVAKEPQLIVELAPGVTGSVRTDEANPDDYELGEAIEVTVRSVDRVRRRINLTTMQAAAAAAAASASAASAPQTTMTASGFAPLGIELAQRKK